MLGDCGCAGDGEVAGTPGGYAVDDATGYTVGTPGGTAVDVVPVMRGLTDAARFLNGSGDPLLQAVAAILLSASELVALMADMQRNDGDLRLTRSAFRAKMQASCATTKRRNEDVRTLLSADSKWGLGIPLAVPGLPFLSIENVRANSLACEAWFCSMTSGGVPTAAQHAAVLSTVKTLTGDLFPMTTTQWAETRVDLVKYVNMLNGTAAPASSSGAPMATTPVQTFIDRITLISEAGLINPHLSVARAHNAQARAIIAAFNASTGEQLTTCGPERTGASNDPVVAASRAQFAACRARAAATYAAHQAGAPTLDSEGTSGTLLAALAGAVAGGLMGGPIGAVAGAVIAGAVAR